MIEKDILVMCCECRKIKVDDDKYSWLDRKDDSILYDMLIEKFGERISHTYCPKDLEIEMEKIKNWKATLSSQ
jgi:hypothetical protein